MTSKVNRLKSLAPLFTTIAAICGGFVWLYANFATITAHEKLEQTVQSIQLDLVREKLIGEVYFLKGQCRKYPRDTELADQLQKAETRLQEIETKLKDAQ